MSKGPMVQDRQIVRVARLDTFGLFEIVLVLQSHNVMYINYAFPRIKCRYT